MTVAPVQAVPAISSVDDAIVAVWELAIDTGCSLYEATCDIWPTLRLSQLAVESLAIDGLQYRARHEKQHRSDRRHGHQAAVAWGAPHGQKWHDYLNSLSHPFKGATSLKALYDFDNEDLVAFALSCRTVANSFNRRADWASETQAVLKSAGKTRISDLPPNKLKAVAEAAAEAFQRQR